MQAWIEWKSKIKKKYTQNKANLTKLEKTIVRLCSIDVSVEGVSDVELCSMDDSDAASSVSVPATPLKPVSETLNACSTSKRRRVESTEERLDLFLDDDDDNEGETNKQMDQLIAKSKEKANNLQRIYEALERSNESVTKLVEQRQEEFVSIHTHVQLNVEGNAEEIPRKIGIYSAKCKITVI